MLLLISISKFFYLGDNRCEVDGVMYNDQQWSPDGHCKCSGWGDGYEIAVWICDNN
jgi:hypothetical protein